MVGVDVLVGVGLTVLAWLALAVTVLRGRATVVRRAEQSPPDETAAEPFDEW